MSEREISYFLYASAEKVGNYLTSLGFYTKTSYSKISDAPRSAYVVEVLGIEYQEEGSSVILVHKFSTHELSELEDILGDLGLDVEKKYSSVSVKNTNAYVTWLDSIVIHGFKIPVVSDDEDAKAVSKFFGG